MRDKIRFVTLPALLLLIFFLGKLVMSLFGAPYELGIRVFSMVNLEVHLALVWGAFGRRYHGYRIGGAIQIGILIALIAQILILIGTAVSYPLGGTHFNSPTALNQDAAVGFVQAMQLRTGTLIANCVIGAVSAVIGWTMGTLIPERTGSVAELHLKN